MPSFTVTITHRISRVYGGYKARIFSSQTFTLEVTDGEKLSDALVEAGLISEEYRWLQAGRLCDHRQRRDCRLG